MEEVEGPGEESDVPGNIRETSDTRPFEAVWWDGVTDLFDRIVGDLELVAIGIDKLSAGQLFLR